MDEEGFINITRTGEGIYYKEWNVIVNIFKSAYFHIFGELFIEDNEYDLSECQSTLGYGSHHENLTDIKSIKLFTFSVFDTVRLRKRNSDGG